MPNKNLIRLADSLSVVEHWDSDAGEGSGVYFIQVEGPDKKNVDYTLTLIKSVLMERAYS